jgi:hypothetical protein
MSGLSDASIAVDDARRYSRRIGLRTCESVTGTSGRCCSSSSATRSSCAGLTVDHRRHTATDSTARSRSPAISSIVAASSSDSTTVPSEAIRSGTSNVSARGTYGSGNGAAKLNGSILPPSRNTSTSGWPAVVRSAVRAVLPVMTALIACVVPWMKMSPAASSSSTDVAMLSAAMATASMIPATGSPGVVGALNMWTASRSSSKTKSVNVPPVSTANRMAGSSHVREGSRIRLHTHRVTAQRTRAR